MTRKSLTAITITICLMVGLIWLNYTNYTTFPRVISPDFSAKKPEEIKCSDFYKQTDAQKYFEAHGELTKLDKDRDGVVCESLP